MTRISRHARTTLLLGIGLVVPLGAVASPLVLAALSGAVDLDWVLLGNIGQAYGAAAAVLSALALAAVAASVWYQVGAIRQQRIQMVRENHREVLRMLADDPETYAPAHTVYIASMPPADVRRAVYSQMMINFVEAGYTSGFLRESDLRGSDGMKLLFTTTYTRRFWQANRQGYLESGTRTIRQFAKIVDDEYRKAVAAETPIIPDNKPADPPHFQPTDRVLLSGSRRIGLGVTAVTVAALGAGWVVGRRSRS